MGKNNLNKIFGVGPKGAAISLLLLAMFAWIDFFCHPAITVHAGLMKTIGVILIIFGLGLHFWAFLTLRNWWMDDKLCTMGPFKYFRHPMYAAWITFVCLGVAIVFNSWFYFLWFILLHPIWHRLVKEEETKMVAMFGDAYENYAGRTGRFIPKVLH